MNRFTALVFVFLLWAGIYLPGLGTLELKGEEPRRSLPAMAMLDTGDWVVPHLNGKPYLSKPPLVNWLIAASMDLTGRRDEWAARFPSVLMTLLLALVLLRKGGEWLGVEGGFLAAVFFLTSAAFVEKGRQAEIEADYVALAGMAFAWWLAAWVKRQSGWRLWLVPEILLGLGLLAKGPAHLLLFYAVIVPVLAGAGELPELWSMPHLASLALAAGIFCAWALPYHFLTARLHAEGVWVEQLKEHVGGGSLEMKHWLVNIPRALVNGLPWIVLAPLWWSPRVLVGLGEPGDADADRLRTLVRAARWPLAIGFVGLMLIPGILPRYTLPLYPAGALLLALVARQLTSDQRVIWWRCNQYLLRLVFVVAVVNLAIVHDAGLYPWLAFVFTMGFVIGDFTANQVESWRLEPHRLAGWSGIVAVCGIFVFAVDFMPGMRVREEWRSVGRGIDKALPAGAVLHVIDHGYDPALFYVHRPCAFVPDAGSLPGNAGYVFACDAEAGQVKRAFPGRFDSDRLQSKAKREFYLLRAK